MDPTQANVHHNQFVEFLKKEGSYETLTEFHKVAESVRAHPNLPQISDLYSDWQGHATVSMKRAFFTTSLLTLSQIFLYGLNRWAEHGFWQLTKPVEDLWRLKLVIILAILVSGALYLSALLRDKQIRDFNVYQLRDLLDEAIRLREALKNLYNEFCAANDTETEDFESGLVGSSQNSSYRRFREVQIVMEDYERFVSVNMPRQMILDLYDLYAVPALGVVAVITLLTA
ncbi:hypothetical protein ACFOD1_03455 [Pseudidiomarina halophila]|uniref:Uncharacterized protein n=1 Tax=Pseudidiomarina halophila TaxID=1449799 RepID=A0A432XZ19_9GAMM|nr:hypothetical protein [Pseudidiomarina halophila]RUO54005.1 hypothetical protein CWI69_00800 [Pseudidiomarina halophila]